MTALALDTVTSQHARIQELSRIFAGLFLGIIVLYALWCALIMISAVDNPYLHGSLGPTGGKLFLGEPPPLPADFVPIPSLPIWHRLFFLVVFVAAQAPFFMVFANVRALFQLYARGVVFAADNARRFKLTGLWLIAAAIAPALSQVVQRGAGLAIDRAWFHMWEVHALILGGLLFVISLVMEVGREIEQERAEFV